MEASFADEDDGIEGQEDYETGDSDMDAGSQEDGQNMSDKNADDDREVVPKETIRGSESHAGRRPPNALELRDIKDATELYRSSSFKLQVRSHA